jgi:molybdenum cofactor biosynthesis enzyme
MVDVSAKASTHRVAVAEGRLAIFTFNFTRHRERQRGSFV